MRIKHSFSYFIRLLAVPAITLATGGYFGAYAVWGARGVQALEASQAEPGVDQERLSELRERGSGCGTG